MAVCEVQFLEQQSKGRPWVGYSYRIRVGGNLTHTKTQYGVIIPARCVHKGFGQCYKSKETSRLVMATISDSYHHIYIYIYNTDALH